MITMKAKTAKPGHTILHPDTKIPLRVVEPKVDALSLSTKSIVLAVDDEASLFALDPDQEVEVPLGVPLVTVEDKGSVLVAATFERYLAEDLLVMQDTFRRGKITADPQHDLGLAVQQQIVLELGVAYEENVLGGRVQCHRSIIGRGFDLAEMGWRKRA
jgi:hypothetical protein